MRQENVVRYQIAGIGFLLLGIMILAQLVRIQVIPQADEFIKQADMFAGEWVTIHPARGQIYDRWGNLLAGNTTVYEVGVELRDVRNPDTIAMTLAAVLDADYEEVLAAASQPASENAVYAVLADFVAPEKIALIDGIQANLPAYVANLDKDAVAPSLRGLTYTPHLQRSYPENTLASNVLGFVSREGRGYFGVEEKYNDLLAGQPRTVWMPRDPEPSWKPCQISLRVPVWS